MPEVERVRTQIKAAGGRPAQVVLQASLWLLMALAGCVQEAPGETHVWAYSPEWAGGLWWQFDVKGTLPASWMDVDSILEGSRELGHLPQFNIETNATIVSKPMLEDAAKSGRQQRTVSPDPDMKFMTQFGLPLTAAWYLELGRAWSQHNDWVRPFEGAYVGAHGPQFFSWPLESGKTWTMEFMKRDIEIRAESDMGGYSMTGTFDGEVVLRYHYDPEVEWFTSYEVVDGGETILSARLIDHGAAYTGELFMRDRGFGSNAACYGGQGLLPLSPASCGRVPSEVSEQGAPYIRAHLAYESTGPGFVEATREGPSGMEQWHREDCPCDTALDRVEQDLEPGKHWWGVDNVFSGDRWVYFRVFTYCFDQLSVEAGTFHLVEACRSGEGA